MKINIKTDKYAPVTALITVPVCAAAVRLILFSPILLNPVPLDPVPLDPVLLSPILEPDSF